MPSSISNHLKLINETIVSSVVLMYDLVTMIGVGGGAMKFNHFFFILITQHSIYFKIKINTFIENITGR